MGSTGTFWIGLADRFGIGNLGIDKIFRVDMNGNKIRVFIKRKGIKVSLL